ncbi:hypothetical protein CDD83_2143 [Cordyceps sp. RAO-2017]|nr:hypothetical protein CDD83_2143 [Cordyceps sp. RAO-2017]
MAPKKVLVVLTSADKIDKTNKPTGWYLPEFAHVFDVLKPKAEFVVASPKGGVAPLDPGSAEAFASDASCKNFLDKHRQLWEQTKPLADLVGRASEFDAIFYPGGHGPMLDLVDDKDSIRIIEEFWRAGKPVAALCHGPIALVRVVIDGQPLLRSRRVTGFTNKEEAAINFVDAMPFLLEDEAKKCGAEWLQAPELQGENVVVDGNLITGQNPASSKAVGEALLRALGTSD